jgi:Zn-dependent peptidase ImmA (M78 family)
LSERRARYVEAWQPDSGPNKARFREGEKLPAKSASTLKHRVADYLERYLKLESILGMRVILENPIASLPIGTAADIEAAAAKVRSSWKLGLGPVVNLLGVLEDRGIRVFETEGIEGFEGLSGTFGSVPFIAVSRDLPLVRIRFTAAHELGHTLGRFLEQGKSEGMCHRFAGAFLLPREAVEKVFRRPGQRISMGELSDIKKVFGISIQAIMGRAKDLGLVSDRRYRAFREIVKDRGWAVTEPVVYMGVEQATKFRGLIRYAVAADIIDLEQASQLAGVPAAELEEEMGEVF